MSGPSVLKDGAAGLGIRRNKLATALISVTVLNVASKGANFLLYLYVAYAFGLSKGSDSLLFALAVYAGLGGTVTSPIENVMVPLYIRAEADTQSVNRLVAYVWRLVVVIVALAACTAVAAPVLFTRTTALGAGSIRSVQSYLIELLPAYVPLIWNSAMRAGCNAAGRFRSAAVSAATESCLALALVLALKPVIGAHAWPAALMGSGVVVLTSMAVYARRTHLELFPKRARFWRPSARMDLRSRQLMLVQIFGSGVVGLTPVIDQSFASFVGQHALSAYAYSARLFLVPTTLMISGFLPIFLGTAAKLSATANTPALRRFISKSLLYCTCAGAVVAAAFFLARPIFLRLVLERGRVSASDLKLIEPVFAFQCVTVVPYVLLLLLGRIHIILFSHRLLLLTACLMVGLNSALDYALSGVLGLRGIAAAACLTSASVAAILYLRLPRTLR